MFGFPPQRRSPGRRRGDEGTAAIEFAILAPMLALMVAAVVEIGLGMHQQIQAQDAAAAGALYAAQNGGGLANIASAVANAKPGSGVTATPAPSLFCGCPGASGVTTVACSVTLCSDGTSPRNYVLVNASVSRTSFFSTSLPLPVTLTASATARLQ